MGETALALSNNPLAFMMPVDDAPQQDGAPRGAEDVDRSTISIPRIVVVQKTSTAFEDAQYGELWNTLTEQMVWPLPSLTLTVLVPDREPRPRSGLSPGNGPSGVAGTDSMAARRTSSEGRVAGRSYPSA